MTRGLPPGTSPASFRPPECGPGGARGAAARAEYGWTGGAALGVAPGHQLSDHTAPARSNGPRSLGQAMHSFCLLGFTAGMCRAVLDVACKRSCLGLAPAGRQRSPQAPQARCSDKCTQNMCTREHQGTIHIVICPTVRGGARTSRRGSSLPQKQKLVGDPKW